MRLLDPKHTFYETYLDYQALYSSEYSREKFKKTFDVIANSEKVRNLCQLSANKSIAPAGKDFFGLIFTIPYFIFAKNDTRAIGAIIALFYWDQTVNAYQKLADEKSMFYKIEDIFGNLRMN